MTDASEHTVSDRAPSCLFHPFELAICGFKNSGKTTLAERLIGALAAEFRVGYVKHDGHAFAMDREGKDTQRAAAAGAGSLTPTPMQPASASTPINIAGRTMLNLPQITAAA